MILITSSSITDVVLAFCVATKQKVSFTLGNRYIHSFFKCMLCFVDSYGGGSDFNDMSLSLEAVEALGFLIEGSVDKQR